jgi:hypothetical protein
VYGTLPIFGRLQGDCESDEVIFLPHPKWPDSARVVSARLIRTEWVEQRRSYCLVKVRFGVGKQLVPALLYIPEKPGEKVHTMVRY